MPPPPRQSVEFNGHTYAFSRYPEPPNNSHLPFGQPDRMLLDRWRERGCAGEGTILYHDRFGTLTTVVGPQATTALTYASQYTALLQNFPRANEAAEPYLANPLHADGRTYARGLLRVPKSLALFELYLAHFAAGARPGATLACGFLTRHFTPGLLDVASRYAETVEQTRAEKKARLLLLTTFRTRAPVPAELRTVAPYREVDYQQYYGVFSRDKIDYGTQFLLDEWRTNPRLRDLPAPARLLDLACGNGVIGDQLRRHHYPEAELTAVDDSYLATASAQLNLPPRTQVITAGTLADVPGPFDLIVTNPPFHFEYETNINISLRLFAEAAARLRPGGRFVVVANRHLGYGGHLGRLFGKVELVAEDGRFGVWVCV